MTLNTAEPAINPRLGPSFAIFASAYACLVLLLIIGEQLGLSAARIDRLMLGVPILFYIAIGLLTRTKVLEDMFASGQRVPPFYGAMAMCAAAFGGTMLMSGTGTMFFLGFDGLALPLGCFIGFILMAALFVPFWRKAAAYTLPGFFYLRFGSQRVRALAALLMIPPVFMLLHAELSLGAELIAHFLPGVTFGFLGDASFRAILVMSVLLMVIAGGMRSATWVQCAQFVGMLGILAPLLAVSVLRTNLPIPQLTYGSQIEAVAAQESAKGIAAAGGGVSVSAGLPSAKPQALASPSSASFSAIKPSNFALLVITLALGVASFPSLLPKLSTSPTILASRRSLAWTVAIAAFIVLTLPAYAMFTKAIAIEGLVGVPASNIPSWGRLLEQLGAVNLPSGQFDAISQPQAAAFRRDAAAFILPAGAGMPRGLIGIVAASALAALCAAATAHLFAIAAVIGNDLYSGTLSQQASPVRRILITRIAMLGLGLADLAFSQSVDPLRLAIAAFSLSAGTFFSALVLSVWWRGLTASGLIMGLLAGFGVSALVLASGAIGVLSVDPLAAGAVGAPVSFVVAFLISLVGRPSEQALEAVEELRVPAGETLNARTLRLAARGKLPLSV